MKWTNDPNNPAGPIQVKRANDALKQMAREHDVKISKSGIFGKTEGYDRESEYETASFMICGENPKRADVTAAQEKIGQQFNWTVSRANVNDLIAAIATEMVALKAARPVEDKRQTQEAADAERLANQQASQQRDSERNAKTAAEHALFIAHYGVSAETITVPEGMMPVTISLKFDNSDSMTDYFDRHAQLGPDFLLGYVPKQAQTQSVARRLLEHYPEFAKIGRTTDADGKVVDGYDWKTENYSMGHGNYLDGASFELPADLQGLRQRYGAGDVTQARWQVEFNSTGRFGTDKYLPLRGYPGANNVTNTEPSTFNAQPSTTGANATVSLNAALNGVEIRFPGKPAAHVISSLKTHGFRWAFRSKCWYRKQSPAAIAFANGIAGVAVSSTSGGASVPASREPGPDTFDMQVEDNMAAACGC